MAISNASIPLDAAALYARALAHLSKSPSGHATAPAEIKREARRPDD
jgi:hypothetical protein